MKSRQVSTRRPFNRNGNAICQGKSATLMLSLRFKRSEACPPFHAIVADNDCVNKLIPRPSSDHLFYEFQYNPGL